jgi:hypothetical protein
MNVYNYFTKIIVGLLEGNIGTLMTHNSTLDLYTKTSRALSTAWTSGTPNNQPPGTPGDNMWQAYQAMLDPGATNQNMVDFIKNYMTGPDSALYIPFFSAYFGTLLMSALSSKDIWGDGKAGPSQMNEINQWNSMIASIAQNQENTGQNGVKSENSVLQADAGTQQPLSDMGTSGLSIFGNIVAALQRQYS